MTHPRTRRPLGPPVPLLTALTVALFLAGFLFLGYGFWREYRNSIIDGQKDQMLLTTQALSRNMESLIQEAQSDLEMLSLAAEEADRPREATRALLKSYVDEHPGSIHDILITGPGGQTLSSLKGSVVEQEFGRTRSGDREIVQVQLSDGRMCLMVGQSLSQERCLWLLVDLEYYYQVLISGLRLGTNGYVLVKNSSGVILMHPEESQLGIDVISGREELYPGVDLDSLETLVDLQNQGGEGVMEYYSYWWMDPDLPRVRKVAAWSPVSVGDDFLVVSAVMDYDDIYVPIAQGMTRLALVFLAIILCIVAMTLYLGKLLLDRRRSTAEISDLKELNRTLEELHRSEEAIAHQQRLQVMGTMTGGIAHEFNNLLTPILGHAELMMMELPPDSELYDSAKEITQAANHCQEIIRQLSMLSRKNVEAVYKLLPAQGVLERVMKMVRSIVPESVSLTVDLDLGEASILGNETQLSQVLLNVCVNAFHAIGSRPGSLTVTARVASAQELTREGLTPPSPAWDRYVRLDLADDGCGMSQATLEKIFDPFFTTKKSGQGTGLGLALAEQIIRSHKGSITAQSQLGRGSVFHILLPVAREEELLPPPAGPQGRALRVLLAGDNPKVLGQLRQGLIARGLEAETAVTREEVLDFLAHGQADVLVADSALEEDMGLEVCISVRGWYPQLIRILLTDRPTRQVLEARRRGHIHAWLEKPVSADAILQALSQLEQPPDPP